VAYNKDVLMNQGQRVFDLALDSTAKNCRCPMCKKFVTPTSALFNNCLYKWEGLKCQ
jgi:hypothetical protein